MAIQVVNIATGTLASGPTAKVEHRDVECKGHACPHYQAKQCKEVMCLQFMLPNFPGLGVWQIDTGSINSILNINSDVAMVRAVVGHINMVPLMLSLEPQQVVSPEDGKKKTVMVLHLRASGNLARLIAEAKAPLARLALPSPDVPEEKLTVNVDEDGVIDEDMGSEPPAPAPSPFEKLVLEAKAQPKQTTSAAVTQARGIPPATTGNGPAAQGNGAKKPHQKASPERIERVRELMRELGTSEEKMTKWTCEKWGLALGEILPEQAEALIKELEGRVKRAPAAP